MKKIIGILFFIVILVATSVLAAYPEELENKELEQLKEGNIIELTNEQVKEAEKLIVEPANDNTNILNESNDKMYEESDLYEINEEISITKRVNGNVYAMGQKIKIDGAVIKGNAFILGQEIEIKNVQIEGSLYVFGEKIEFSGVVNDLYVCGSNITIDESGNIWRDVKIAGSIVEVNGTIGRNAFIAVNELSVGENTVINGELNYISQNQAEVSSNSKIGNINFQKQEVEKIEENVVKFNPMTYLFEILKALFKTFIIAVLIIVFSEKFKKIKRTENVANELLKNTGFGAIVLILVPILSIVLLFTGVASGMGFIAILLYIVLLYASSSVASVEIAERILNKIKKDGDISNGRKIGASVFVAFALYLIGLIPFIGGIVKIVFILIGLGVIFNLVFKKI